MTTSTMTSAVSNIPNLALEDEKMTLSLDSTPKTSSSDAEMTSKHYNDWPNDQGVGILHSNVCLHGTLLFNYHSF